MSIQERLKHNRPELAAATLYSYSSTLKSLYKRVFGNEDIDIAKFDTEYERILTELEKKPASTRKTTLAILFSLTKNDHYKEQMMQDIQTYNEDTSKQVMNEKQMAAFVSQDEIRDMLQTMAAEVKYLYSKKTLTPNDLQQIQQYIILCVTSGYYFPPRRALDWCAMRTSAGSGDDYNYIQRGTFVFNRFKGSREKGQQRIAIPLQLRNILKKWIAVNPTEWLLFDANGSPLDACKLKQRLHKIFGSKTSINNLRHSYLSTKFQDQIQLNRELEKTMAAMGSSTNVATTYIQQLPEREVN